MLKFCREIIGLIILAAFTAHGLHAQSRYPGEAAMVIHYCGKPSAENHTTSPITGNMQRDLYYGDTILHFAPIEDGWGFTTAWQGNLPISRRALEARMPCFAEALAQAESNPRPAIDPTIAMQTVTSPQISSGGLGMPFLWLIVGLAIVLILLAALPGARREQRRRLKPEDREFRKPGPFVRAFQTRSHNSDRLDS